MNAFRQALAASLLLLPAITFAQAKPSDYDVKAADLFNFGRFLRLAGVDASAQHHATFDICIVGHDPLGHVLDDIAAKESIGERTVRIVHVADAYAARECEMVFISADEGDGIRADLTALGNADVLTVSDALDFLECGGMIQFVKHRNRVRFEVNLEAVSHTHLVLGSELLRIALTVRGKSPEAQR